MVDVKEESRERHPTIKCLLYKSDLPRKSNWLLHNSSSAIIDPLVTEFPFRFLVCKKGTLGRGPNVKQGVQVQRCGCTGHSNDNWFPASDCRRSKSHSLYKPRIWMLMALRKSGEAKLVLSKVDGSVQVLLKAVPEHPGGVEAESPRAPTH
jgi:hypothetical protein